MKKTPLYSLHIELGAKMVSFAGFEMPVQYQAGIIKEHLHTRSAASLFDISHMGQIEVSGPSAAKELERLVPLDLDDLSLSEMAYTVFPNERGGTVDDLIVTRRNRDNFLLVVNAACKDRVVQHLSRHLEASPFHILNNQALLAVQGPKSRDVLLNIFPPEIAGLKFMTGMLVKFDRAECFLSRSGYTGGDGYEIAVSANHVEELARRLLTIEGLLPAGLGARDSLRLEAGLCLYGHELDESISLIEAGLGWTVSKGRRQGGEKEGEFIGSDVILPQLAEGVEKKRIGLKVKGKAPVREGAELFNHKDEAIGSVTSGTYSPSLGHPIAMAYINREYAKPGTIISAQLRGKSVEIEVVSLPLIKHSYVRS